MARLDNQQQRPPGRCCSSTCSTGSQPAGAARGLADAVACSYAAATPAPSLTPPPQPSAAPQQLSASQPDVVAILAQLHTAYVAGLPPAAPIVGLPGTAGLPAAIVALPQSHGTNQGGSGTAKSAASVSSRARARTADLPVIHIASTASSRMQHVNALHEHHRDGRLLLCGFSWAVNAQIKRTRHV